MSKGKHIVITKAEIKEAFKKETQLKRGYMKAINDALKSGEMESDFWGTRFQAEFEEVDVLRNVSNNGVKFGDYWKTITMVNGREPHLTIAFWRDATRYNRGVAGMTPEEQLEASEREKVLWSKKGYRISLLRTKIRKPTDTYWGYRIEPAEYALIDDNTNEVLVLEKNKAKFTQAVLGKVRTVSNPIEELEMLNPFRMYPVKATDKEALECMDAKMGFYQDTFTQRYYGDITDDMWVVYIFGLHTSKTRYKGNTTRNGTWFIYRGETEPTYQQALEHICAQYEWYRGLELYQVMEKHVSLGVDMNSLNFYWEDYKQRRIGTKFREAMEGVFGVTMNTVYNTIFPEKEKLYSRYQITKEGKIPLENDPNIIEVLTI